jgi:amidophosphoribosyltransferase
VKPGEVVIVDNKGDLSRCQVRKPDVFSPCIFEYIYFARPASIIEGASVSGFRYACGKKLGEKLIRDGLVSNLDVMTDVPATATRGAISCGKVTGLEYFPMFDKNHYVGRSFIESTDLKREHTAALKFTPEMGVLLELTHKLKRGVRVGKVDDSFVRGKTNRNVNDVLRETGMVEYILDCSLSPRIEWPCVYGIDMPIRKEFVARDRTDEEVAKELGADKVVYLPRESLRMVAEKFGIRTYCEACFSGVYPTGITRKDLERIERERIDEKNGIGK